MQIKPQPKNNDPILKLMESLEKNQKVRKALMAAAKKAAKIPD
jgi:hypothetical protein